MSGYVVLGMQGAQTWTSAGRGIARYCFGHANALARKAPEVIAQVSLVPHMPLPDGLAPELAEVEKGPCDRPPASAGRPLVYHVLSPLEGLLGMDQVWPAWARADDVGLVVTVYDLIPLVLSERYQTLVHGMRWYRSRLELLLTADAVLAISDATARDLVDRLGLEPERVHRSYIDTQDLFRADSRPAETVVAGLRGTIPGLKPAFYLYVAAEDTRKNMDNLVRAYRRLPAEERAAHQLVIVGKLAPETVAKLISEAAQMGVGDRLLLPGPVPDPVLRDLYQSCHVFVFPSFYEGFGLPVLEAMRCGAVVVASDASSLVELVEDPEARFDPGDPEDIARVMLRASRDAAWRQRQRELGSARAAMFTWDVVAERSLAVYREVWARRRRVSLRRRGRRQ